MKIVHFSSEGQDTYGKLENNTIFGFKENPFVNFVAYAHEFELDGNTYELSNVKILPPSFPSKIVCLGLAYRAHAEEIGYELKSAPLMFFKPTTAMIGHGDEIVLPSSGGRVEYEGELAIIIGKEAKNVPENKAYDYILGYTCCNDVSERHAQEEDGLPFRAKGFDTFAPIGPWIETEIDPDNVMLETYLNGELRQHTNTSDFIFKVGFVVSFISNVMTLLPGDVIETGTPAGVGPMNAGDVVEVKIEGIGTLKNIVVDAR